MAKKQVPEQRDRTPKKKERIKTLKKNSKTQKLSNTKTKKSSSISPKNKNKKEDKNRNEIREKANDDASSEETEFLVVPSSSMEPKNDEVVESEEDEVGKRSSSDEDEDDDEKETLKSIKERGKTDAVKKKGKKRSREEDDESDEEDKGENSLYRFPMNRVSRIIKSDNPDIRITQEAVFVINRASEKFLQAFCREAYAYAFLDNKKHTSYEHLSTIVSRRKRLNFLSDIIPEKVKAEDALAKMSEAGK